MAKPSGWLCHCFYFDSKKKKPAIIGTGHTSKGGVPHAEIMAMNSANKNLDGATLYVTLEPCCHIGKSKPCTQSIIKNNLKRVVIAMVDPNPLVAGKGIQELKKNGIEVVVGCCRRAKTKSWFYTKLLRICQGSQLNLRSQR